MKQKENKFLVINYKRFREIEELSGNPEMEPIKTHPAIANFLGALENLMYEYQRITGRVMNQKYIVCNEDEPYAGKVWDLILENSEVINETKER